MGRRQNSVMTSLWLDQGDWDEITRRADTLNLSKAEVIRRMIRYALAATTPKPERRPIVFDPRGPR